MVNLYIGKYTENINLKSIINRFVHKGLTEHSPKSAQFDHKNETDGNRKGIIFAVRSKECFMENRVKGFIITSKKALIQQANSITHWTPNIYRFGSYTDNKRTYIKGFEEYNLQQINAFVFEVDSKELSAGEIILRCENLGLGIPTMLVETDRGYHIYFALTKPIFIDSKSNFKALMVAKRIANNVKSALFKEIGVDFNCNSFGFFRMPTENNVVWYSEDIAYDVQRFMTWSMNFEDDYTVNLNEAIKYRDVISLDWIVPLLNNEQIKGGKGQLGRNNIMFTLALSCLENGKSKEETYDIIDQYNSSLKSPLSNNEVMSLIKSAFSGKYKGASKAYINNFYELYCNDISVKKLDASRYWYKHKKQRKDRQRVHFDEWEIDLINLIESKITIEDDNNVFFKSTQAEICQTLKISSSTLNEVLKKTNKIVKRVIGKGRGAKTEFTTLALLIKRAIKLNQERGEQYKDYTNYILSILKDGQIMMNRTYSILVRLFDMLSSKSLDKHRLVLEQAILETYGNTG